MCKNIVIYYKDKSKEKVSNVDLKLFDTSITFNLPSDKNIDEYISSEIIPELNKTEISVIYIKDSLSSNYLELYGLRVAYHIRLSQELRNKIYMPIVILSDIDSHILNKLSTMARILFTKNIFIVKNTKENINKFQNKLECKILAEDEYKTKFLNLIEIEAAKESHHDIANKWAIHRWAEIIKAKSDVLIINENSIKSMLYFKYLLALYPEDESKSIGYKRPKLSGKILYIDDEWNKGWDDIFTEYFKNTNIEYKTFTKKDFSNTNVYSLRKEIKEYINVYNPDVILLDLRLIANDHSGNNRDNLENYTGIQIREAIAEVNPGIQVIMFTATSKSLILEELYKHNILGYIKKEHLEDKSLNTKENIGKLAKLIDEGLERKYLKKIWNIRNSILELEILKNKDFEPLRFEIESIFELLDSSMNKRFIYAMLSIFQALEEINNYYIDDKTKGWRDGYTETEIIGSGYTKQKIEAVLKRLNLLQIYSLEISKISRMRKDAIHPPQRGNYETPNNDDIVTWFKMLQTILVEIDKCQN